uniref:DUF7948 domain-containing protein n=1 Tax=candidate division WOR-3 bacterium TaxID=2052148 RepID=A0A7C4UAZ9_UNCW3
MKRVILLFFSSIILLGYSNGNELWNKIDIKTYKGFEENFGQVGDFEGRPVHNVLFSAKGDKFGIFVTDKGVSYVFYQMKENYPWDSNFNPLLNLRSEKRLNPRYRDIEDMDIFDSISYARVDIEVKDVKIKKENIIYEDEVPGYTNYYLPQCPDGILYVKRYRKVRIKDIYPGIDWVWKYENGRFHYEFELGKDADIERIKFRVRYGDVNLERKRITISTPIGVIVDGDVVGYEGSERREIFYKRDGDFIGFEVRKWERKDRLIIDPPLDLLWSTYYGGDSTEDYILSVSSDRSGNIITTGYTNSDNFPTEDPGGNGYYQGTRAGGLDLVIIKFNNDGVRLWGTYYGGEANESGCSTTDSSGNIFVEGATASADLPTYNPGNGAYYQGVYKGEWDAFILKFNPDGIREWATYFGGSSDDGTNGGITTDKFGNIFITFGTHSSDLPTYNPGNGAYYQDGLVVTNDEFILKFSNEGILEWGTYYGGSGMPFSIATDRFGNVLLTGRTSDHNFPLYNPGNGAYFDSILGYWTTDIFILKFNNNGVRLWATFYGDSNNYDDGYNITSDIFGNIFVVGTTVWDFPDYDYPSFPTYNPGGGAYYQSTGGYEAFILKFNNNGERLWATLYGGSYDEEGYGVTTDKEGNLYLLLKTYSPDVPTYNPGYGYFDGERSGGSDLFLLKFTNNGVREWGTYFGGSGGENGYINSITTDIWGNIIVVGQTGSSDFPTVDPGGGAYYQGVALDVDGFIAKFETPLSIKEKEDDEEPMFSSLFFRDDIRLRFKKEVNGFVKIYNIIGEVLYEGIKRGKEIVIDDEKIRRIPKGVYFLEVNGIRLKIIKI